MNHILDSLFDCALRGGDRKSLTDDEFQRYKMVLEQEETLEQQLEQLLEGEALRLFELYVSNSKNADYFADASSFRSGLAIGLKLAAFCMLH